MKRKQTEDDYPGREKAESGFPTTTTVRSASSILGQNEFHPKSSPVFSRYVDSLASCFVQKITGGMRPEYGMEQDATGPLQPTVLGGVAEPPFST